MYSRHIAKKTYEDRGYKHLYEEHHDCDGESCFGCKKVLCETSKSNYRCVNHKERALYQVENEEMSCMDVNVSYDK